MLDTHRIAKRFKDAGVPEAQAEAMLETFVEWRAADVAELATKGDVSALGGEVEAGRTKLEADIAALRREVEAGRAKIEGELIALETRMDTRFATMTAELRAAIIGAKVDLLKWFIPLFAGQILALMALVVQIVLRGP